MLPSPTDLTYFLTIAQLGNLTQSAQRLGVSQPSLTLAMQRLENCIGAPIFVRSRQGVKLNKAGERLLIETRNLMNQWNTLQQQAVDSMNEIQGRFSLGCHPSVARYTLPLFLPTLLTQHPNLELNLVHDLSRNITQRVQSFEIDIGVVVNPTSHADLVMKPLAKDAVTLWKGKDLQNSDVLICEPSLLQTQTLQRKLTRAGFDFKRTIESASLEVISTLVACGAGLGILPGRVAEAAGAELTRVRKAPVVNDEIFLIYRTENRQVRTIQALSKAIQNGFADSRR